MAQKEQQSLRQEQSQQSVADVNSPFSLSPAIFTPFSGFTSSAQEPALDQTQQLLKIIENLKVQQDAVKNNMLFLIQQRADTLRSKARQELEVLEKDTDEDEELLLRAEGKERERRDIDNMFQRLKASSKNDGKSEYYKANLAAFEANRQHPAIHPSASDGDVEMSGMDNPKRTGRAVREELSSKMRELVDRGTQELEAYDAHAQVVLDHYRKALQRRAGGSAPTQTASVASMGTAAVPSKGILKNANDGGSIPRLERRRSTIRFADDL